MSKRINFNNTGGHPIDTNMLALMQDAYKGPLFALSMLLGNKVIVSGVVVDMNAQTVSDGWICVDGELLPFVGGNITVDAITGEILEYVALTETAVALVFEDGQTHDTEFTKSAALSVSAGQFLFKELIRLDSFKTIQENLKSLLNAFTNHAHSYTDLADIPPGYVMMVGTDNVGDIGNNDLTKIINLPADAGNSNYIVAGSLVSQGNILSDNTITWCVGSKQNDKFTLSLGTVDTTAVQNVRFEYAIIKIV